MMVGDWLGEPVCPLLMLLPAAALVSNPEERVPRRDGRSELLAAQRKATGYETFRINRIAV